MHSDDHWMMLILCSTKTITSEHLLSAKVIASECDFVLPSAKNESYKNGSTIHYRWGLQGPIHLQAQVRVNDDTWYAIISNLSKIYLPKKEHSPNFEPTFNLLKTVKFFCDTHSQRPQPEYRGLHGSNLWRCRGMWGSRGILDWTLDSGSKVCGFDSRQFLAHFVLQQDTL